MLSLQEQRQFVGDLTDLSDKLFELTEKFPDDYEYLKAWSIIYNKLKSAMRKEQLLKLAEMD